MPNSQRHGPIAIIDVETTGLFPLRHDRVVEVAAIVIDGDGRVMREFVSLVNPGRDIGSSRIHGLTSEDVLHAPQFGDIASLLVEVLQGTVAIAGHNVKFDHQFIESEFSRVDCGLPECFTVCTMHLAGGGRLSDCCSDYGISFSGEAHHALTDARATARLLANLLPDQPRIVQKLSSLAPIKWPTIPSTEKHPITREDSRRQQADPPFFFLQRLLGRMHAENEPIATEGAVMAYVALLDRVLEDRRVDDSEADALVETAAKWGLSRDQICAAHREYVNQLAIAAVADGIVTDSERRDLGTVTRLLGLETQELEGMLRNATSRPVGTPRCSFSTPISEATLTGKSVCFTGELQCHYNGKMIPREVAEELAGAAGLIVVDSVTKKLDLLVIADPHSQSGKAKKARQYGIRIVHEPVFWKAIGVGVN